MKKPEVSVIISTYNRKTRLKRALDSVLNQNFKHPFEVIVVDDCSTDGTEEMMRRYLKKHNNIIYHRLDENFGSDTKPKNIGCRLSRGKFIAYLDDDNRWHSLHLYFLHKQLTRNPSLDVAYSDMWIMAGKNEGPGIAKDFDNEGAGYLLKRNFIDTSEVMHKREAVFDVGGWDETLPKFIDWNIWVRMMKAGKNFARISRITVDYYLGEDAKSKRVKTETYYDPYLKETLFVPTFNPVECKIDVGYLREPKKLKVALFTLTYDRLGYTKRMFNSLENMTEYPYDHFVIDNGSTDGTKEYLTQLEKGGVIKKLILNKKNKGISKASNQAIDEIMKSDYDIIVKVDNDCEFESKSWLKTLIKIFGINRNVILSPYVEGLTDNPGGGQRTHFGTLDGELAPMANHIGGICCAAPRKMYENFKWKEEDLLHGNQDVLFSNKASEKGFYPIYIDTIRVYHMDSTEGQKEKYKNYFKRREKEKTIRYEGK